jgi:phi LC3 family holin
MFGIDWKKRLRSKQFVIALCAFIALTGKVWGLYEVPEGWTVWVDLLLTVLTLMGVVIDPSTDGFSDKH